MDPSVDCELAFSHFHAEIGNLEISLLSLLCEVGLKGILYLKPFPVQLAILLPLVMTYSMRLRNTRAFRCSMISHHSQNSPAIVCFLH